MWFIIRAVFCIGVVFSMAPGFGAGGDAGSAPSIAGALASPALTGLVDGALTVCKSDPKFCFDMAQRLVAVEAGESAASPAKATVPATTHRVGDTLTAGDRAAAPWRGVAKEPRAATRLKLASRP